MEVGKDGDGNLAIFAKEDIDAGKIIALDKAYLASTYKRFGWICNICLKKEINLMPCKTCAVAMFCEDCQNNPIHKYVCGLIFTTETLINGVVMNEVRTIVTALSLFTNAQELMEFVEKTINRDPKEIPTTLSDEISKYKTFLKLPVCEHSSIKEFISIAFFAYKMRT